jgi:hypothetical protein
MKRPKDLPDQLHGVAEPLARSRKVHGRCDSGT